MGKWGKTGLLSDDVVKAARHEWFMNLLMFEVEQSLSRKFTPWSPPSLLYFFIKKHSMLRAALGEGLSLWYPWRKWSKMHKIRVSCPIVAVAMSSCG
jgi:hypothetical protein